MEETGHKPVETQRPRRFRGPYQKKYSSVTRHIDWYLQVSLSKLQDENLTMEEIQTALESETGINMTGDTIRKYNAQQFLRFETAPLTRVSDTHYALNSEYYRLMGAAVSEPGKGKAWPTPKERVQKTANLGCYGFDLLTPVCRRNLY